MRRGSHDAVGDTAGATAEPAATGHRRGGFRTDIQGLRAVAVLLVVLDHADLGPFHGGYIGVDVFFVVSGFLITGLLLGEAARRGRISLLDFYARRARRILPAATVVLVATVAASYVLLPGVDALRLFKDAVWATFFAANIRFASEETDYWAQGDATSPIQHYWSLAVEEQFYLVWPLVVLALVWWFHRWGRSRRAILVAITAISAASLAYAVLLVGTNPTGAYFSSPARAWELGAGAAVAVLVLHAAKLPRALAAAFSWAGLAAVGVAAVAFRPDTGVPGLPTLLPVLGTCLLLAAGAAGAGPVQRLLGTVPMRWVGDRSYSYYLWHWPALIIADRVWGDEGRWVPLLTAVAMLALSDLTYRFVENPFREARLLRPTLRGLALYPASAALLGLVVWAAHAGLVHQFAEKRPAISVSNFGDDDGHRFSRDPQVALVQASVLAARNDRPIPNPLKPEALGLADHVAADLQGCEYAGLPDPMPLCPRGDVDGDRTLVLVGDSHARHWIPAVDEVARRHGFRAFYFVYPGCTPALVQPWSPTTNAPDTACTTFHDWSQEQIEELRPDLLLMSSDAQQSYVDEDGERVEDRDGVAGLIEEGMVDRIESLRPLVGRIAIIADPPRLRFNPETMFDRDATLRDGLSAPHRRSMVMRSAVRRAAERTDVQLVETRQWFCAYGQCPVVVGDYITRRDRGHLTLEYSASLAAPLGRALGLDREETEPADG